MKNRVYMRSCKMVLWPIRARVLFELFYKKTIQHPYTETSIYIKSEENLANRSLSRTKLRYILKDKLIMTRTVCVFVTVCLHCWYYLRYSGMADPTS